MEIIGIIPARYASTRFPGKPLARIGGVSMIERVVRQAEAVPGMAAVVVATDDERIYDHVRAFGGQVAMTRADHPSGTDRCAEVAEHYPQADVLVNIQGDEPFIDPLQIASLFPLFERGADIATLARPIERVEDLHDPNVVKVTRDQRGRALYFSRHAIPYVRGTAAAQWLEHGLHWQHLGLYAYRSTVLRQLTQLPPSAYELAESLEQLRWLEAGYHIHVGTSHHWSMGIDTPADLVRAEAWLRDHQH